MALEVARPGLPLVKRIPGIVLKDPGQPDRLTGGHGDGVGQGDRLPALRAADRGGVGYPQEGAGLTGRIGIDRQEHQAGAGLMIEADTLQFPGLGHRNGHGLTVGVRGGPGEHRRVAHG